MRSWFWFWWNRPWFCLWQFLCFPTFWRGWVPLQNNQYTLLSIKWSLLEVIPLNLLFLEWKLSTVAMLPLFSLLLNLFRFVEIVMYPISWLNPWPFRGSLCFSFVSNVLPCFLNKINVEFLLFMHLSFDNKSRDNLVHKIQDKVYL